MQVTLEKLISIAECVSLVAAYDDIDSTRKVRQNRWRNIKEIKLLCSKWTVTVTEMKQELLYAVARYDNATVGNKTEGLKEMVGESISSSNMMDIERHKKVDIISSFRFQLSYSQIYFLHSTNWVFHRLYCSRIQRLTFIICPPTRTFCLKSDHRPYRVLRAAVCWSREEPRWTWRTFKPSQPPKPSQQPGQAVRFPCGEAGGNVADRGHRQPEPQPDAGRREDV